MPTVTTHNKVNISMNAQVRRAIALVCAVVQDRGRSLGSESVIEEKAEVFDRWIKGDEETMG